MIEMTADGSTAAAFAASRALMEAVYSWAQSPGIATLTHGEIEAHLIADARETFRQVFQETLDLRAEREMRVDDVTSADGVAHRSVEEGHHRPLESVFGTVTFTRTAYRHCGEKNLCPADGVLNLPVELQSHGLRRIAAIESTRDSFEGAVEAPQGRWEGAKHRL